VLNFNNNNHVDPQTTRILPNATLTIPAPRGHYTGFFVHMHSSEGSSPIQVTVNYADGSSDIRTGVTVNDYASTAVGTNWFVLTPSLAKWGTANQVKETANHWLFSYDAKPNSAKDLVSVDIKAAATSKTLTFWGATGVVK
jgi:hypothetical protein